MRYVLVFIVYFIANIALTSICNVNDWQFWAIDICILLAYIIGLC